jgi:cytochrome c oxidase subunit II
MSSSPRIRRSPTITVVAAALVLIALAVLLVVSGAAEAFVTGLYPPIAVTQQGARVRELYTIVFVIAAVIFLIVEGLIIWTVIRYRRQPGDDVLPAQTHGNNVAELAWTIIPTIIVAFLFVISWQTLNEVDTASASAQTKIRAVAGQFQWQFDYLADDGQTVKYTQSLAAGEGGGLYIPAGRDILLSLTSQDVIHAFYVPQFLFKRDVVPGRVNKFDFKVDANQAGQTFRGQCAELCGAGHRIMLFEVHALAPDQFDAWLADQIAKAKATPPAAPSGQPGASGQPAPSGGQGAGPTLQISAANIAYEQASLEAPANTPFSIEFDNKDPGVPHNVSIHKDSANGQEVFKGDIFNGPDKRTYNVPALEAGAYAFVCSVHPNMTGTLTVK